VSGGGDRTSGSEGRWSFVLERTVGSGGDGTARGLMGATDALCRHRWTCKLGFGGLELADRRGRVVQPASQRPTTMHSCAAASSARMLHTLHTSEHISVAEVTLPLLYVMYRLPRWL
jgi:hypothetical protein